MNNEGEFMSEAIEAIEPVDAPDTSGMQKSYGSSNDDIRAAVRHMRRGQDVDRGEVIKPAVEMDEKGETIRSVADKFKSYRQRQERERSALDAALGLEPHADPNVRFDAIQDAT